jgi:hypothetical protein
MSAKCQKETSLADFDLALSLMRIGAALHPFDRLCLRLHLEDPVAGDQLLGFSEGAVNHRALGAGEPDACALRARLQPVASSITPAFTISSLNFAMAERSSSEGILPASESLVALTITMNRIVVSPIGFEVGSRA